MIGNEKQRAVAKSEILPALLYSFTKNKPRLSDNIEAFLGKAVQQSAGKRDFATALFARLAFLIYYFLKMLVILTGVPVTAPYETVFGKKPVTQV